MSKVILIATGDDWNYETLAPSPQAAVEYFKGLISEAFDHGDATMITIISNAYFQIHYHKELVCYYFFEVDVDKMYETPHNITRDLIPIFREFLIEWEYPFKDVE